MLSRNRVFVALALGALSASLGAQGPAAIGQIPVFAGAVRDAAREAEVLADRRELHATQAAEARAGTVAPLGRIDLRVWRVKVPADSVAAFYRQRLAALDTRNDAASDAAQAAYYALRPGKTTPVLFGVSPVSFDARLESHDFAMTEAKVRAAYVRLRRPFAPNLWVNQADFDWDGMTAEKQRFHGSVSVAESGVIKKADDVPMETELQISIEIMPDSLPTSETEPVPAPPLPEPAAAKLGVQKYPGARYDAAMSGGMSADASGEATLYVYYSNDAVATVRAFYERTTGKKGQSIIDTESVSIAVVGVDPFPKLGVIVSKAPPQIAPVKTVITVRHGTQP